MRPRFADPIARIGVRPDDGETAMPPRPRGSRRPHTDARVASVRRLIEETTLTYAQIEARTGVGRASICRWTRDGGWTRPAFAPRATDTVPRARASAKLRLRLLAGRLAALAERYVRELEETPGVDIDRLMQALQALKMARLEAMGRRRRRWRVDQARPAGAELTWAEATRAALKEMHRGGVNIERAPREALDLVAAAHKPAEEEHPAVRPRR